MVIKRMTVYQTEIIQQKKKKCGPKVSTLNGELENITS